MTDPIAATTPWWFNVVCRSIIATMAQQTYRPFTENQFLSLGLELRSNGRSVRWKSVKHETKISNFRSTYGPHPRTLACIWHDLQTIAPEKVDLDVSPERILLVYRWLKSYESEEELHTHFGHGEKSIRAWCKAIPFLIAGLRVLKLDPNWEDDDDFTLSMTVDGIHYKVDEPRPFGTDMSSHKEGGNACVDYEFGIYAHKDKVCWLNGPYPAGTGDREILKDKLLPAIEKKQAERLNNFRVIADDGYFDQKLLHAVSFRNELDPREIAYFKDCALSRHEKFNGLTKTYGILKKSFRHDRGANPDRKFPRHKAVIETIVVTLQYELDLGIVSLFDPYP